MTATIKRAGGLSAEAFQTFIAGRDEPSWLLDLRKSAWERFQATPLPTLKEEEWRRTDIRGLKLDAFAPATGEGSGDGAPAIAAGIGADASTVLAHVNGAAASRPSASLPEGVIFCGLAEAVAKHPELVKRHLLTKAVGIEADAFAALHGAFWSGGAFLYIPAGVKVPEPLFHVVGLSGGGQSDFNHTLVVLEEGAEASLVQECLGRGREGAPGLHVGAVEILQAKGSRLRFVNIQDWDDTTWHFSRERAIVEADARLQWTVGGLGSKLSKVNQEVTLAGPGARAQVNGVMFTTGKQHLAYFTRQDHAAPNTTSDLLYKGGLKDRSRVVWKGMIRVEPDAQKTDAYQKNENLILSDSARADSIPGLEIEANDVRCTHGATASRVDDNMVFYAQSRGVPREDATRLIVEGFFANVFDRIAVEPVREALAQAVAAKVMA